MNGVWFIRVRKMFTIFVVKFNETFPSGVATVTDGFFESICSLQGKGEQ